MHITVRYDIPINEYDCIKAGSKLEVISSWNEYDGFIAVLYKGASLYFNSLYFEEIPVLIEVI